MMKNRWRIFSLLLFLLLLGVQDFSQGQRMSFHANMGLALPKEEKINAGFESGFGFSLPLGKRTSLSLDFGYWKSSVEEDFRKLYKGKLSITPLLFCLDYAFVVERFMIPYISFGAGVVFSNFKIGEYISIPEVTFNQSVENGVALHLGGGVNLNLTRDLLFFAELSYLYREAIGKTVIKDMNLGTTTKEFSLNLSSILLELGIKYFF